MRPSAAARSGHWQKESIKTRLNEDIQLRLVDEIYETSEDASLVVLFAWRVCPTFQRSDVTRSMLRPGGLVFGAFPQQVKSVRLGAHIALGAGAGSLPAAPRCYARWC